MRAKRRDAAAPDARDALFERGVISPRTESPAVRLVAADGAPHAATGAVLQPIPSPLSLPLSPAAARRPVQARSRLRAAPAPQRPSRRARRARSPRTSRASEPEVGIDRPRAPASRTRARAGPPPEALRQSA